MEFDDILKRRIQKRIDRLPWDKIDCFGCYIAGNSLNRETPNDYDLFQIGDEEIKTGDLKVLFSSKNARTVSGNGNTIQICHYMKKNLKELVKSFDFSHIQVGAALMRDLDGKMKVEKIYYTEDYIQAKLSESSEFTGSDYPLSSLIRLFKYVKRGNFSGKSYMWETLNILEAIVTRGFDGYADFKDQLDAVDLGLLPEELSGAKGSLFKLFTALDKSQE